MRILRLRMRAFALGLLLSAVLPGNASAAQPVTGTIVVANPIPTAARAAYTTNAGANGLVGYVAELPSSADGKQYVLVAEGPLGVEDFDAYFYTDLSGADGTSCRLSLVSDEPGREVGYMCPEAGRVVRWVIVVMRSGVNGSFKLSW